MVNLSEFVAVQNGLQFIDTLLLGTLAVLVGWCFLCRPLLVVAGLVGLMVWWEAGPDAPVWPVFVAMGWLAWRATAWLGRLFVGERVR